MTQEALKLALEAYLCREMPAGTIIGDPKWWVPKIAMAIKEALAQPEQEPVVHDPLPRACNLAGVDYQTFLKIKAYMPVAPPQPERHELQAKGGQPAPCARHCEANAFQIVIKNLKAQLAQPEQKPVAWYDKHGMVTHDPFEGVTPLYTTPPQRTWVGLTGLDQKELMAMSARDAVFATEAKLKEKNGV